MRKFLALASDASIERAVNKAAEGLPVYAADLARVVDALTLDGADSHDTARTVHLESTRRDVRGSVPVWTTFGRGTEADAYERLDGIPVGSVESLASARIEARAVQNDLEWQARNAYAESGAATTRANRNTARRRANRARR